MNNAAPIDLAARLAALRAMEESRSWWRISRDDPPPEDPYPELPNNPQPPRAAWIWNAASKIWGYRNPGMTVEHILRHPESWTHYHDRTDVRPTFDPEKEEEARHG